MTTMMKVVQLPAITTLSFGVNKVHIEGALVNMETEKIVQKKTLPFWASNRELFLEPLELSSEKRREGEREEKQTETSIWVCHTVHRQFQFNDDHDSPVHRSFVKHWFFCCVKERERGRE